MSALDQIIKEDDSYLDSTVPTSDAVLLGRMWRGAPIDGPSVILVKNGVVYDITSSYPTTSYFLNDNKSWNWEQLATGHEQIGTVNQLIENANASRIKSPLPLLLAPCDLQAIKACGVTFAASLIERVIEEKAAGDPARAKTIRRQLADQLSENVFDVVPGSEESVQLKRRLIELNMWSQYLEVGIGPDAEVFTKAPLLSAVGHLSQVGIHPGSSWNNPEPEIVLAVNASGEILGATLGNDVNLRDVEGRSALLLGKAKDNNGSCSIGPFIRLFDEEFTLSRISRATVTMAIHGVDGFKLVAESDMSQISRSPEDLVAQVCNENHQYPDGFMLFLGTMFAPTDDRDAEGQGFTHKPGDVVEISVPEIGKLVNSVAYCDQIPPWNFGVFDLMRSLSQRGLV